MIMPPTMAARNGLSTHQRTFTRERTLRGEQNSPGTFSLGCGSLRRASRATAVAIPPSLRRLYGEPAGMGDQSKLSPGLADLDAMIARAEAACERGRRKLEAGDGLRTLGAGSPNRRWRTRWRGSGRRGQRQQSVRGEGRAVYALSSSWAPTTAMARTSAATASRCAGLEIAAKLRARSSINRSCIFLPAGTPSGPRKSTPRSRQAPAQN